MINASFLNVDRFLIDSVCYGFLGSESESGSCSYSYSAADGIVNVGNNLASSGNRAVTEDGYEIALLVRRTSS